MICSTVITLMRCYFSKTVLPEQMDAIVAHIVTCKQCKKEYKEYAKKIGVKFNLIREVQKAYALCEAYNVKATSLNDLINRGIMSEQIVKGKRKWTQYALEKDIPALANVKCVNDFFNENITVDGETKLDCVAAFGWWKVEQMCKTIDTLNNLLKLSGGDEYNEKP